MHPLIRQTAAVIALTGAVSAGNAGSYSVNPVKIELTNTLPVSSLRIRNTDTDTLSVQVEVKKWSQVDGEEILVDTRELIAVPPVFTLPQGGQQVVRVGLRDQANGNQELAYRIILREIPTTETGKGLNIALSMSIPAFVAPTQHVHPKPHWLAEHVSDSMIRLSLTNSGNAHFKFSAWELLSQGNLVAAEKQLEYLLPGTTKQWTVSPATMPPRGEDLKFRVTSAGRKTVIPAAVK